MNAENLKKQLGEMGWSQKDLATRLECDADTVSRWCTGRTPVPGHVAEYMRVMLLLKQAMI